MSRKAFLICLVALVVAGALPWLNSAYTLRIGTMACLYAVMAVSWTVIGGFAGYPSFATAAFFGFGAYCGGVLITQGWPLAAAAAVAGGVAFVGALLLGIVLLRLRGHYFAVASLAVAEVLRELANAATDLTGGGMGLNIPLEVSSAGAKAGGIQATVMAEASFFYWAMWALLLLCFIVVRLIEQSRLGFGLVCIRQNESAADMIGINGTVYKSLAFGFSGIFVAMAGTLYAAWVHYIEPTDVFDVLFAVKPIVMALLGGLGSAAGALLGALAFLGVEELLWRNMLHFHAASLGLLIVLLLLFLPNGLISIVLRRRAARVSADAGGRAGGG